MGIYWISISLNAYQLEVWEALSKETTSFSYVRKLKYCYPKCYYK